MLLAAALPCGPADATTYVYHDSMEEGGQGHTVPKLVLTVTPDTTSISVTQGSKLTALFPPEVTIDGKAYDGELSYSAPGLPAPYGIDETGSVFDSSDGSTSPAAGTYTFTYVVTDDDGSGLSGTSAPVTITVKPKDDAPFVPSIPVGSCGQILC